MTIRCVDYDSYADAINHGGGVIITKRRVLRFLRFRVCFGNPRFPNMVDCKHRFVCKGSKRIGWGRYETRVKVVDLGPVV